LIQNSRLVDNALVSAGLMSEHGVPREQCTRLLDQPLERLLRCEVEACHLAISEALWDASSAEEAVALLQQLADTRLDDFERRVENDPSSWPSASDRSGSDRKNDVVPVTAAGEGSWEVGGAGPRGLRAQADGGGAHAPPARSQDGERGDGKNKAAASLLDLRVGTVVDVAPHPSSPGLWVTKLDMGPDATAATSDETMGHGGASLMRTAVTARDPHAFATGGGGGGGVPSERTLPKVVVLTNLKARDFAGVTSDALVLFSEGADGAFAPVTAPPAAPAGAQVVFLGVKATPLPPSSKAGVAWRRVEREGALQVGADGVARLHTRSRVQRERADGLEDSAGGADEGPGLREQRAALKAGLPLVCRMPDAVKGDAAFSSPSFFCTSAVAGEIA
jgi:tRNA-binding EMAP/Myf-like protein